MAVPADLWGLVAFLAAAVAVYALLYARRSVLLPTATPMTFLEHANELRTRAIRIVVLFVAWSATFLAFRFEISHHQGFAYPAPVFSIFDNTAARIYLAVAHDTVPEGVQLIVSRPTEAVGAQLQVSLLLAFVLTLPAILYELWAFFTPGLTRRERRAVAVALPVSLLLFVVGAGFGYTLILPLLLRMFYAFAAPLGAIQFLSAGTLVTTVVTFAFLFGLAFQLPLVQVLLVRLRILTPHHYVHYWRHVTLAIFIIAAFATDPTLVSQIIVGAILLALYWGGIAASYAARPGQPDDRPHARPAGSKAS